MFLKGMIFLPLILLYSFFSFPIFGQASSFVSYVVIGGTDATADVPTEFTESDITKLSSNDDKRIQSNGDTWPIGSDYDESKYIEVIFNADIPADAAIESVTLSSEWRRSGALTTAKIEIWDGSNFISKDLTIGTINVDHMDTVDISSILNTAEKINNTKIRFLAYRDEGGNTKTSHDYFGLTVTYNIPSSETSGAPTYVTDDITEDIIWSLADSPYIVQKYISVLTGATLTIEPGVIVKFAPYTGINISGGFSAEGTIDNKIYFTSLWDDSIGGDTNGDGAATIPDPYTMKGYWRGISFFSPEGGQSLKNIALSRAQIALFFNDATANIEGLAAAFNIVDLSAYNGSSINVSGLISENSFGSVFNNAANLILSDSVIKNGLSTIYGGVNLSNASHTTIQNTEISKYYKAGIHDKGGNIVNISNTQIFNNYQYGIFVGNSTSFGNSQYITNGLTIRKNTQYGAFNQATSYSIDLRNVYWGTPSGPRIPLYPNDLGNRVSKGILFSPWLITDPGNEKFITSFSFQNLNPAVNGAVDETNHAITLSVPFGTDVTTLAPTIAVSVGASVSPGTDSAQDFTSPVVYTVTAKDGSTQDYAVTVTPTCSVDCFSNVLFIPGFQGSRMYKIKNIPLFGDVEDKLWEPNSNADIKDMYMDEDGVSINKEIYTRDIIEEKKVSFLSGGNLYKSFMEDMDAMVADGTIAEWRSVPYDWRLSPRDVVNRGILENGIVSYNDELDTGELPFIINQLQELVDTSKGGQVTIVTHSNGGLVAKALVKKLTEMKTAGQSDLIDSIDKLIMVAAPQIGTPKAIAALLHGYSQEIGYGFILKQKVARKFGANLPGAYSLLPSVDYFKRLQKYPVVLFDKSIDPLSLNLREMYGYTVDSFLEFNSFLLDKENNRLVPAENDVINPSKLNEKILNGANTLHGDIDADIFPDTMKVYQVAGWGLPTVKNITYYSQKECISSIENKPCTPKNSLSEYVNMTVDGDETVISPSATYITNSNTQSFYFNMGKYIDDLKVKGINHSTIFEVPYLRTMIKNILVDISTLPAYITEEKPVDSQNLIISIPKKITKISVKSKNNNKKTGDRPKIEPSDISEESSIEFVDSDFDEIDEEIPGSSYTVFGGRGYIVLPSGGGGYTVYISGVSSSDSSGSNEENSDIELDSESNFEAVSGSGVITIREDRVVNDQVISTTFYPNVPITPSTQVEFTTDEETDEVAGDLLLDTDGDGTFETTIPPVVVPNLDPVENPDGPAGIPEEFQPQVAQNDETANLSTENPDDETANPLTESPVSTSSNTSASTSSGSGGGNNTHSIITSSANIIASSALVSNSSSSSLVATSLIENSGEQTPPLVLANIENIQNTENIVEKADFPEEKNDKKTKESFTKVDILKQPEETIDSSLVASVGSTGENSNVPIIIVSIVGSLGLALVARYFVR